MLRKLSRIILMTWMMLLKANENTRTMRGAQKDWTKGIKMGMMKVWQKVARTMTDMKRGTPTVSLSATVSILFIWFVTAVDCFCCQWLTPETELNPIAQWILIHYSVWYLIGAKIIGTAIATECLRGLHYMYSIALALVMLLLLGVLSGVIPV